jgi:hypothetical protein
LPIGLSLAQRFLRWSGQPVVLPEGVLVVSRSSRFNRAFVEPLETRRLLAAALLDASGKDLSSRKDALTKGVNLSHVFWLPRYEYSTPRWEFKGWQSNDIAREGKNDNLLNDWEDYVNASLPRDEIVKIKRAGFTYVRLPVDMAFLFDFDETNPSAGGSMRGDNLKLLRSKVRDITDRGLSVVIAPFRTDNTTNSFDMQIWDPRWQTMLEGFVWTFTRYISRFPRDFNPDKVFLQPFNEPHLSEIWRAGYWEEGDWVVRSSAGEQLLRIRPFADQPIDELTVNASAWAPIQNKLVNEIRRVDTKRRFTILTATPLDAQVVFKDGNALGELIYDLEANRNNLNGLFAEASLIEQRDFDTMRALESMGRSALVYTKSGAADRNVVYGLHYYANGILSTESGDYYSRDYSLLYPLPFYLPALSEEAQGERQDVEFIDGTNLPRQDNPNGLTARYAAVLQRTLSLVQQRLGVDANGYTLDESEWVGLDYDRQFIRDRRQAIDASGPFDAFEDVRVAYVDNIVPAVARLFRYDLRSGTPESIRDAVDRGQRWADRIDLDPKRSGRQRPFVVVDEFGIRDHSWQLFGDTYRYVRPFEGFEYERTQWLNSVRSAIDGTSQDNGKYAERMGWAVWDYLGELAVTEPETSDGGDPYLYGVPSEGTVLFHNIVSYRRRLTGDAAGALDVLPYGY